jgi:hypothetical protein
MNPKNKFAAFTATIVSGGTLALANNIGFRSYCEIHESEPACNLVSSDPLHTHQEAPSAYGTNTTTLTSSGDVTVSLTGVRATFNPGVLTASGGDPATGAIMPMFGTGVSSTFGTGDLKTI